MKGTLPGSAEQEHPRVTYSRWEGLWSRSNNSKNASADIDQTSKKNLKHNFDQVWKNEKVPKGWKKGLICQISKKGNLQ